MKNKYLVDYNESQFSKIIANRDYVKKIMNAAYRKCSTNLNTPISKKMNIELRTWKKFLNREYIKSLTYYRLSSFCNISKEAARKGIQYIDEIEDPKLPLNFNSKEGVRLDVGIVNEGRIRSRIVEYTNKDKEVLNIIKNSARKVISNKFSVNERTDKRDQTVCLSFPPIFAKHFLKIGINGNKNYANIRVPNYILDNEEFHRIWWQGNISEEASIYSFIAQIKNKFYLNPRIQLNRVKSVLIPNKKFKRETTYYQKDIPKEYLKNLKANIYQLINDEVEMLSTFDIHIQPYFSKLYINSKFQQTATYTILINRLKDLEKYLDNIPFELERHKNQFKLLLNNKGVHTKEELRDIIIKFYKLVPHYLRGIKRIKTNKWLTEEDKSKLMVKQNVETNHSDISWSY